MRGMCGCSTRGFDKIKIHYTVVFLMVYHLSRTFDR